MRVLVGLSIFFLFLNPLSAQKLKSISTKGHNILAMDIDQEKQLLVTGGDDKLIKGWSALTGANTFSLSGHDDFVTSIALSNLDTEGRKYLASGGRDGKVIIYDYDTRSIFFQQKLHEKSVYDILFVEQYSLIVTAGGDGSISFIDLNSKTWQTVNASSQGVLSLTFVSEKGFLSTSDAEGNIKWWNPASKNLEMVIEDRKDYIRSHAEVNNKIIVVGDDKSISVRNATNGDLINTVEKAHKKWIQKCVAVGDNSHFATGDHAGQVTLWDSEGIRSKISLKHGGTFISGIAFSKDLTKMYSSSYGAGIIVWDISSLSLEPSITTSDLIVASNGRSSTSKGQAKLDFEGINLVQPYLNGKKIFHCTEEEFIIKGMAYSKEGISKMVLVHKEKGEEQTIRLGDNNRFEEVVKLGFFDNNLELKLTTKAGNVITKSWVAHRIFDQKNPEELVKLDRNGRDYALIIATNDYNEINNLTNPIFDATTIANELSANYNFEVEKVINPSLDEIKLKIKEYSKKMFSDEDQLFIFIAGHGEYDDFFKEGYIVASDSKSKDEARSSYLPHSTLRTYINNIPCEHIFLVMDVCFGGTFDPVIAKRGSEDLNERARRVQLIKRKLKYKTRFYLTSGGKEYVPDGRPGHHSPFARKFIDALRTYGGTDKILTSKDIVLNVEAVTPEPRFGEFGDNEPGSDFLFISSF